MFDRITVLDKFENSQGNTCDGAFSCKFAAFSNNDLYKLMVMCHLRYTLQYMLYIIQVSLCSQFCSFFWKDRSVKVFVNLFLNIKERCGTLFIWWGYISLKFINMTYLWLSLIRSVWLMANNRLYHPNLRKQQARI